MESSRTKQQRGQGVTQPLDRRLDQLIETGRQVVDGVAGTRPGMRRNKSLRLSTTSFAKVGRWVSDRLDWFLEDEDDWLEPWQLDSKLSYSGKKKPLDAISRRVAKPSSASENDRLENSNEDSWPEESSFRVDRWKRGQLNENSDSGKLPNRRRQSSRSDRRPLPRSSRRR